MSSEPVVAAAGRALGSRVTDASRVGGGDINEAWALELGDGSRAFLKSRPDALPDEYEAEAAGLRWLAQPGGLRAPAVLAVIDEADVRGLALAWVESGSLDGGGEEELGRGLAITHAAGAEAFDALPPGSPRRALRFGGVEIPAWASQPGHWRKPSSGSSFAATERASEQAAREPSWPQVYAARLEGLTGVALDRGRISSSCAAGVEAVRSRLGELAGPPEPPARVHGDLWSGNVLADQDGRPWLIDPAAHGAHRELDLAMLRLFGSVSQRTLAAYEELHPLAPEHEERIGLWQLQPLLVHAILFGGSYGAAVERTAARYA